MKQGVGVLLQTKRRMKYAPCYLLVNAAHSQSEAPSSGFNMTAVSTRRKVKGRSVHAAAAEKRSLYSADVKLKEKMG